MPTTAETVAEYFAAIRAMDANRWVAVFAPDGITNDPVGTPPVAGHEALRGFITHIFSSFQSVALTECEVYINGASAAVHWTGHAVAPSGKEVDFAGIDVIDTNEEGKITLVRAFWDPAPVFSVLTP
jgi:steroid delta-isomerase